MFDDILNVYDGLLVAHADIIKAASKLRSLDANSLAAVEPRLLSLVLSPPPSMSPS